MVIDGLPALAFPSGKTTHLLTGTCLEDGRDVTTGTKYANFISSLARQYIKSFVLASYRYKDAMKQNENADGKRKLPPIKILNESEASIFILIRPSQLLYITR